MAKDFATNEFRNQLATWQNRAFDPNLVPGGTPRHEGSVFQESGTWPTVPIATYFNLNGVAAGWARENLVNLRIYNMVRDFGAVADGVTDCTTAIRAAVAAADAAGGGIIYFPPSAAGYAVYRQGVQEAVIPLTNRQNIVFMGDGYNSWIKFTGNAGGTTVEVFRDESLSERIVFVNLRFNADTLTNFGEQTHWIQLSSTNPYTPNVPAHDLAVINCWFDPIRGDCIRCVGGNGAFAGDDLFNLRILTNTFNTNETLPCRVGVCGQRDMMKTIVVNNWFAQTGAQSIDFEPGGGEGPSEWVIVGNILETPNAEAAVTLSGLPGAFEAHRDICAFNILINGGCIESLHNDNFTIVGNIVQVISDTGFSALEIRNLRSSVVNANILVSEDLVPGADRSALYFFNDPPGFPFSNVITNNLCRSRASTSAGVTLRLQDSDRTLVAGNLCFLDQDTPATDHAIIQLRQVGQAGGQWTASGNLAISTNAVTPSGIRMSTINGQVITDAAMNDNLTRNTSAAIQFETGGGGTFAGGLIATRNNALASTSSTVFLPTNGAAIDANAGTFGAQVMSVNLAAGPNAVVTAPPGSICANIGAAGVGRVLWYKPAGTGNTGWLGYGPLELTFGAVTSSAATAARFFAPGGGQAVESTVEIQMRMPRPGVLRSLRVRCTAGVGGGNNTYTLRLNGVNSAQAVTIANTATSGVTAGGSVAVVAGDLISLQVTKTVAPGTPQTNVVITLELI